MLRKGIQFCHPLTRSTHLTSHVTLKNSLTLSRTIQCKKAVTRCTGPSLFSSTRCNLLPPQLVKFLLNGAVILFQAFWVAYSKETSSASTSTSEEASSSPKSMSPAEAIQILGIEQVNPRLLEDAKSSKESSVLPLSRPSDREVARKNFERMFAIAIKHDNMYLAGKISAAYRLCVDPDWDAYAKTETAKHKNNEEVK